MLGRLRPVGLAEFGLNAVIGDIVEFWRRRHPQIDYRVTISPNCEGFGEVIDDLPHCAGGSQQCRASRPTADDHGICGARL